MAVVGLVLGCGVVNVPEPQATVASNPAKVWTRDEFKALVMGKTKDELLELVGNPDDTGEFRKQAYWHYYQRTQDPVAKNVDPGVMVYFDGNVVVEVEF